MQHACIASFQEQLNFSTAGSTRGFLDKSTTGRPKHKITPV
jgi:hypothetical protein